MEPKMLDDWMTMYEKAWRTAGTDTLDLVFSEDVSYKVSPFKKPLIGLTAVKEFWETGRDGPDEGFTMTHEIVSLEGDAAVVRVDVAYGNGDEWKDLWILKFGADGTCTIFEEWPFKADQDDGQN